MLHDSGVTDVGVALRTLGWQEEIGHRESGLQFGARFRQQFAQIFASAGDPAFDGADVDAKGGRNLFVGQVEHVAHRENFPVFAVEALHACGDEGGKLA